MRAFNANFITEKNKRADGPAPVNLLTFGFAAPVYISDRDITPPGGSAHAGLVLDWGFIDSAVAQTPGQGILGRIETADLQLTLINSASPRFSDNFTADDPPENITVQLYQWFDGLQYSEKETIFKGVIRGQPEYTERTCTLLVRGVWADYNTMVGEDLIISAADYPGADPDDIGKMGLIMLGTVVNAPCRSLDAGGKSTLVDDWTAASPGDGDTREISDASAFPASGAFTIQIDLEQIRIASRSGNTLTLAASGARGYNATTAVAHDTGAAVAEMQAAYVYLAAAHPVQSIDAVYVDGIRQTSGFTAYTGQSGDEYSGYSGLAVVVFDVFPVYYKQVNLAADDTVVVTDTIDVDNTQAASDTIGVDTGSHSHTSDDAIELWPFDSTTVLAGSPSNANYLIDRDHATLCTMTLLNEEVQLATAQYATLPGTPKQYRLCIRQTNTAGISNIRMTFNGQTIDITAAGTVKGSWVNVNAATDTWVEWNNLTAEVKVTAAGSGAKGISEAWIEVSYTPTTTAGPATGVAKTGTVTLTGDVTKTGTVVKTGTVSISGNATADMVIGKQVTVDADGAVDDGAGTYTGTPAALIERPDHVFKYIWGELLGAPSGDIDGTSFTAAGTFYAANSYAFALVIYQPVPAETLLTRLAVQCRSRFLITPAGQVKLIVRQLYQASAHAVAKSEIQRDSVSMRRSPHTELINYFTVRYAKNHAAERNEADVYQAAAVFSDGASISRFGQRRWLGRQDLFWFDAVTDAAMALHVGGYFREYCALIRKMPEFSVFLDNLEIEPGDLIDITHDLDALAGFVCEVFKVTHHLGSARRGAVDHLTILAVEN